MDKKDVKKGVGIVNIKKLFCPRCGSKAFYTRLDNSRRCKKCGYIFYDKEVIKQ